MLGLRIISFSFCMHHVPLLSQLAIEIFTYSFFMHKTKIDSSHLTFITFFLQHFASVFIDKLQSHSSIYYNFKMALYPVVQIHNKTGE